MVDIFYVGCNRSGISEDDIIRVYRLSRHYVLNLLEEIVDGERDLQSSNDDDNRSSGWLFLCVRVLRFHILTSYC